MSNLQSTGHNNVRVLISVGEPIDKIAVLEVKAVRSADQAKPRRPVSP